MEFFQKGKTVMLRSHLNKYLLADEDGEKVRQSRNVSSSKAMWTVEFVEGKSNVVCLKGCYGRYLTASEMPFLLGMTGKKVIQSMPSYKWDSSIEWEPEKEGFQVKLRSWSGTYLRANGGTPPWRNSITHDVPQATSTQNWILWDLEVVENPNQTESFADYQSQISSLSSASDELGLDDFSESNSPRSITSTKSPKLSFSSLMRSSNFSFPKSPKLSFTGSEKDFCCFDPFKNQSGMDLFHNAKAVRLRSHHDKYLLADEDEESVCQERNGSSRNARWTVDFLQDPKIIRLKSCYGKYLTASDVPFLLGMTGHKVLQTLPRTLDSSVEWEPLRDGFKVKLKTRQGHFLRANGGLPPWRNSVTHDIPHVSKTQEWILWDVDIVEIKVDSPVRPSPVVNRQQHSKPAPPIRQSPVVNPHQNFKPASPDRPSPPEVNRQSDYEPASPELPKTESSNSFVSSPPKPDGRTIYYNIADEYGEVEDDIEGPSFIFKGTSVDELTQRLEKETGLQGITVCSRNILNDKLYPLRLHLPPNNTTMHVVVVPSSSRAARDLMRP